MEQAEAVMITTVKPLSPDHARALEMACQLHELLEELKDQPGHGPGSCVEDAWERMYDVVVMLEPAEEPAEEECRPPTREESRAAYLNIHGVEPPSGWPPPRLHVVAGKDAKP